MLPRTHAATTALLVSLVGCRVSTPPEHSPSPSVPESDDSFDMDAVAQTLEPIVRCPGRDVLWGGRCVPAPDVLVQLARAYRFPAALLDCETSFMACGRAAALCDGPDALFQGEAGQRVTVRRLADALHTYGENNLAWQCDHHLPGACDLFARYPQPGPHCRG